MAINNVLRLVVASLLFKISVQQWRDPDGSPRLEVARNATGALRPGDLLELTCTSHGMLDSSNLHWIRTRGGVREPLYPRGRSPLAHLVRVTSDLHAAEYSCAGPYSDTIPNVLTYQYTIRSEPIRLEVEGGNEINPFPRGSVVMTSVPAAAAHRVNDTVAYTCAATGLQTTVLDVIIAKGNAELQLHTGYQPTRTRLLTLSEAAHGAAMYCAVTSLTDDLNSVYSKVSNRVPIYIQH